MSDPLTRLADLATAAPDPVRAERTRGRCRARLARQGPGASAPRPGATGISVPIWQPLVVVLGVGYMAEVIREALRVYGLP
jgi:hypothetical protein